MSNFWETTPLKSLSQDQWESLCDGCGKCCLHKLIDEETNEVAFTWVSCKYLDLQTCKCSDYENRLSNVPSCIKITYEYLEESSHTLPESCAYRLLHEKKPLYEWHPLISKNINLIHELDKSVKDKAICEREVQADDLEMFIID